MILHTAVYHSNCSWPLCCTVERLRALMYIPLYHQTRPGLQVALHSLQALTTDSLALLLSSTAGTTAASASKPTLGRRALLQSPGDWSGGNRPAWFNNNRVQSGNWGNSGFNPGSIPNWGSNTQSSAKGTAQAGSQSRPQQNPRNRKGDISALNALTSPVQGLRNVPRQSIAPPTTGPASTLYQGLRRGGNAKANAQSLAETFNSNSEAAATAVASAATEGGSSVAVAEAVAQTTVSHPGIAPGTHMHMSGGCFYVSL